MASFRNPLPAIKTLLVKLTLVLVLLITGCSPTPAPLVPSSPGSISTNVQVERIFGNLSFPEMTNLIQPHGLTGMIYVTQQPGVIRTFDPASPELGSSVFLDIRDRVNRGGDEEGLLGLAFSPNFTGNDSFYVYYTAAGPRRAVLSRFTVNDGVADPKSENVLLEIAEPFSNHNGGQLAFGPDGYLYIGVGDGGSAGDPLGNGQNPGTLLGSILRIDVSVPAADKYGIPPDNPFVNATGARPEIWAYGLRNPWRFAFDTETGLLWAGDVGQNLWEEIDIIRGGANYGWNTMEGFHCYNPTTGCNQSGLTLPVFEYSHSEGCSITGGFVYRGNRLPFLQGDYVYGDYCSGNIWALGFQNGSATNNTLLVKSGLSITSFGTDASGNIYVLDRKGGIYVLLPAG